ncbi:MAG: acetamidase/formamidase family protein [Armatimonadetes bacterium]|nr:acetamidase/formamidase family protein [Armatimonadota bacterium]
MKRLWPSPQTVHWGYFDASLRPVLEVNDGETLHLRSITGFPDDPVPREWLAPEVPAIVSEVKDRLGPHILTGPVAVRGARPGHVLQVDILSIKLGMPYGINVFKPLKGIFPEYPEEIDRHIIPIDLETGMATVLPGVQIPSRPFFGILGVAPPPGWGRINSVEPRKHGGNMDNKELVAGTTVFFPVWADGALFSAGDGHAAQGDGEVNTTAIETSLEAEFRLRVRTDFELSLPIAVTPTHLITMGFDEDLDRASRIALRTMLDLVERYSRATWRDAYRLASCAADLRVTQVVNFAKGIHVMLERGILDQLGCRAPFLQG